MISGIFETQVLLSDDDCFNPKEILSSLSHSHPNRNNKLICRDLAFIVFFTGNDYLTKVARLDIVKLWKTYLRQAQVNSDYIINSTCDGINIDLTIALLGHFDTFSMHGITILDTKETKEMDIHIQTMLWNLVTYKEGVCPDYYHKHSYSVTTVSKFVSYLMKKKSEGLTEIRYHYKEVSSLPLLSPAVYNSLVSSSDHITSLDRNVEFEEGF